MKILGLDLGTRRSGMAIAEEDFIFGRGTISGWENWQLFIDELKGAIAKENIKKIVVGIPHSASGEAAQKAREVVDRIKKEIGDITIDEIDETLTSKEAQRRAGTNRGDDNEEAAKIILEDYLKKNPN